MINLRAARPAAALTLAGALVVVGLASGSLAAGARVAPKAAPAAYPSSYAIIGTIALPGGGFAENPYVSADDTVYVPTGSPDYVAVIAPGKTGGSLDDSIPADNPRAVVLSADDTVFIAEYLAKRVAVYAPRSKTAAYAIGTSQFPHGLGINSDDTLVVANFNGAVGGSVDIVSRNAAARAATIATIFGASNSPSRVAVDSSGNFYVGSNGNSAKVILRSALAVARTITGLSTPESLGIIPDDTLVVGNRGANSVGIVPLGGVTPSASVSVGNAPVALAVDSLGYVYTANNSSRSISKVDAIRGTSETIISGVLSTHGVVVTSTGLVYATTNNPGMGVSVAGKVTASTTPPSGPSGSSVTIALAGLPAGVVMDDSTITALWMGDDTVGFARNVGQNSLTIAVPQGTGTVPLVVEVRGGRPLAAGSFTYAPPAPIPAEPASPPRDVVATAGDASALVTWSAPASSGSFAISHYQVRSVPGAGACITAGLTCSIEDLENGRAYSFEVRALNGAGWSSWSEPSTPVTPAATVRPSVLISGSREQVRGRSGIVVTGTATGLSKGAVLRPWLRFLGETGFSEGAADILVSAAGDFTWERRAGKRVTVFVRTLAGDVASNSVTIR